MRGMGSDTRVKGRTSFENMDCRHCERPNLFNCHMIHGFLSSKCQALALAFYEKELEDKWKGKNEK